MSRRARRICLMVCLLFPTSSAVAARWDGQLCDDVQCASIRLKGRFVGSDFALGRFRCRGTPCPLRRGSWSVSYGPYAAFGNLVRGPTACDWDTYVTPAPDFVDGGWSCHDGRTGSLSLTRVR